MIQKYNDKYILDILLSQLNLFNLSVEEEDKIRLVFGKAKDRFNYCFSHLQKSTDTIDCNLNPFDSGQWCIFLYYLGNSLFKTDNAHPVICDKIYYLNKVLNSCDIYYEVKLPDIFFPDHPFGAVLGRASFSDHFSFSKGCTVGNNNGIFPEFGKNVSMLNNSKVIGKSIIGNNVIISEDTFVKDEDIPDNSIVFGSSPNLTIMPNQGSLMIK